MGAVTCLITSADSWQAAIVSRSCSGPAQSQLHNMGFYGICSQNFPTKQGIIGQIKQFQKAEVLAPLSDFFRGFSKRPVVGGPVASHQNSWLLLTRKQACLCKQIIERTFPWDSAERHLK